MDIKVCDWCGSKKKVKSFQAILLKSWLGEICIISNPNNYVELPFDLCEECRQELNKAIEVTRHFAEAKRATREKALKGLGSE